MKFDSQIFKAYDIRGIYPDQINEEVAYLIGLGYAKIFKPKKIVIGNDVRLHSEDLKDEMINGLIDGGVNVVDIGLISTEMIYFATGQYGYDGGIQVTASHNTKEWHGAKLVKAKAEPISKENGLFELRDFVNKGRKVVSTKKGNVEQKNVLLDFCDYILSWIDVSSVTPKKIVFNANFGYEGIIFKKIIERGDLPIKTVGLNAEPDGNFPKGRPDPFVPENRVEFVKLVKKEKPDFGVTWDADADRVFFATGEGTFLEPYFTNTVLIKHMLKKYPGSKIVYDPRNTRALIEAIKSNGGEPILERVGHSFIKARMRTENAIFCGESSGHTYYRDFWFADSGLIPLMQILEITSAENKSLKELTSTALQKYFITGEVNFTTGKAAEIMNMCENTYNDARIDKIDGISIEYPDWRFNLRSSNTEPLLRLNLEATSQKLLDEKSKEVINIIEKNK